MYKKYFLSELNTHQGGRSENQDYGGQVETSYGFLIVVCDGMGGANGGSVASEIATKVILGDISTNANYTKTSMALRSAIEKANHEVYQRSLEDKALSGMGTTVTALLINRDHACIAHVGDSRIYQIRKGEIIYRTIDHSVVATKVLAGLLDEEEAKHAEGSNEITRALGIGPSVEVDIEKLAFNRKDRFVLTTDGINGEITEALFATKVSAKQSLNMITHDIIEYCHEKGGQYHQGRHDNMTIAIVETKLSSKFQTTIFKKTATLAVASLLGILLILGALWYLDFFSPSVANELTDASEISSDSEVESNGRRTAVKSEIPRATTLDIEKNKKITSDRRDKKKSEKSSSTTKPKKKTTASVDAAAKAKDKKVETKAASKEETKTAASTTLEIADPKPTKEASSESPKKAEATEPKPAKKAEIVKEDKKAKESTKVGNRKLNYAEEKKFIKYLKEITKKNQKYYNKLKEIEKDHGHTRAWYNLIEDWPSKSPFNHLKETTGNRTPFLDLTKIRSDTKKFVTTDVVKKMELNKIGENIMLNERDAYMARVNKVQKEIDLLIKQFK